MRIAYCIEGGVSKISRIMVRRSIRQAYLTLPERSFNKAPNESNLGWATDPSSTHYNPTLIGKNDQSGFPGQYQPVIHYLSKEQFEALGNGFTPAQVPAWT